MTTRAQRLWLVVWLLIGAVLLARATARPETRGVILDHLEFGRRLWTGADVHGPWKPDPAAPVLPLHAPYPPSFGLLTGPFAAVDALLGHRAARGAWALLQLGCLVWIARVLRERLLAAPTLAPPGAATPAVLPPASPRWHLLWLLTALLSLRFLLRDLHGGGGNLINLALCLSAFAAAERGHAGRAGLLLAFSLVTKPTMVWLLPVFWLLGHRRAIAATVAGAAAFVMLTLVLQRFDVAPWTRWLSGSYALATQADAFADPAFDFPDFEWMNQSLRCALARWLGDVPAEFAAKVEWGVWPGLGLSVATVQWITRAVSAALSALVLWTAWRARGTPGARLPAFAAALALSLLLSPLSWKAHHVALLPILFLLVHRAVVARSRGTWWLLGAWLVCCQLGGDLVGDAADEWGNSLYVVTAWDVGLLAIAVGIARQSAGAPRARYSANDAAATLAPQTINPTR